MINVAIVDDHQALLDGIILLLENQKDITIVAHSTSPIQLIKVLKNKSVDVLITDLKMPIMDGFELTQKFLEKYPNSKVIIFSMFDTEEVLKSMLEAGASGYLLKTSPLTELLNAIKTVLAGKKFFDKNLFFDYAQENEKIIESTNKSILTKTETKIIKAIAEGKTTDEISNELNSAVSTIKTHRKNILRKLGLKGKNELIRYAFENKYTL